MHQSNLPFIFFLFFVHLGISRRMQSNRVFSCKSDSRIANSQQTTYFSAKVNIRSSSQLFWTLIGVTNKASSSLLSEIETWSSGFQFGPTSKSYIYKYLYSFQKQDQTKNRSSRFQFLTKVKMIHFQLHQSTLKIARKSF